MPLAVEAYVGGRMVNVKDERVVADAKDGEGEFTRFQKLARALFRVKKRDVPKHEPRKRGKKTSLPTAAKP